jgi:hypothetical protein
VRSSDDLISRASEKFEGRVFGAEDFSRFFKNLTFDFPGEAAPSPAFPPSPGPTGGAVAGQMSAGLMGIAQVVATSPPVAASASAVAATVAAGNGVNGNGNMAIGGDLTLNAGAINVAFNFPPEFSADLVLSEANRMG